MKLMSIKEFQEKMRRFKQTVKVVKEEGINYGYCLDPTGLDFLQIDNYDQEETGLPAAVLINYIQKYFLTEAIEPAVLVEESWRFDESGDVFIELKAIGDDGQEGIFDVWHWGRITRVRFRFEFGAENHPPKLLLLEQKEIVARCLEEELGQVVSF